MESPTQTASEPVRFETSPERYRHWRLEFPENLGVAPGSIARLVMDVLEDGGLRPGYPLKLNSYDLGVDIELADAIQRVRFEHPAVRALIVTSAKDRIFSAGANIYMLGSSSHPFKVNFCKYTNETRLYLEELSAESGVASLAALNGTASGGGYELALACDEILLQDDGNSAVSLPEAPLLAVLPGTGGLTRVVDKRKVRRDLADVFSTLAEGVRGKRAVDWRLVDESAPRSRFDAAVKNRVAKIVARSKRTATGDGMKLLPLTAKREENRTEYGHVTLAIDPARPDVDIVVHPLFAQHLGEAFRWHHQRIAAAVETAQHRNHHRLEPGEVVILKIGLEAGMDRGQHRQPAPPRPADRAVGHHIRRGDMDHVGREFGQIAPHPGAERQRKAVFGPTGDRKRRHRDQIALRLERGLGHGRGIDPHRRALAQQVFDQPVERAVRPVEHIVVIARDEGDPEIGGVHRQRSNRLAGKARVAALPGRDQAASFLRPAFLRSCGSRIALRRRMLFGVTSTISSSSI
jgi:enoyl-CoA hydratase/carnithine racemase